MNVTWASFPTRTNLPGWVVQVPTPGEPDPTTTGPRPQIQPPGVSNGLADRPVPNHVPGFVISELARRAFANPPSAAGLGAVATCQPHARVEQQLASHGITPLPARGGVVSNDLIDRLRDTEGI